MARTRTRTARVHYEESSDEEDNVHRASDEESEPRPKAHREARAARKPVPVTYFAANSLLENVQAQADSGVTVAGWMVQYERNKDEAVADLLTFCLQSCGIFSVRITAEDVASQSSDELRARADSAAVQGGLSSPFHSKKHRAFRTCYIEFWSALVRDAGRRGMLSDQALLDTILNFVIALNTSVIREFRQVATLTAVQLVSGFLIVYRGLNEDREVAETQTAAEKKRGAARAAIFERRAQEAGSQAAELLTYCDALFQGVIAHRFRDVCPLVRATVVTGIGSWAEICADHYLVDGYLKYPAWALSDIDAGVRCAALDALHALYSRSDSAEALRAFTNRFRDRFVELIDDIDRVGVAPRAVGLLARFLVLDLVPLDVVRGTARLLVDPEPSVRRSGANLIAQRIKMMASSSTENEGRRGGAKTNNQKRNAQDNKKTTADGGNTTTGFLDVCLELWNECEGLDRLTLTDRLLDALMSSSDFSAVDLEALSTVIIGENGDDTKDEEKETNGEEDAAPSTTMRHQAAAALLRCSLRRAAVAGKKAVHRSAARSTALGAAHQEASVKLVERLAQLLQHARPDEETLCNIVGLLPWMRLEVYSLLQRERDGEHVIRLVGDALLSSTSPVLARVCAAALAAWASQSNGALEGLRRMTRKVLSQAWMSTTTNLKSALNCLHDGASELKEAIDEQLVNPNYVAKEEEDEVVFDTRIWIQRLAALLAAGEGGLAQPSTSKGGRTGSCVSDAIKLGLHALRLSRDGTLALALPAVQREAVDVVFLGLAWRLSETVARFQRKTGGREVPLMNAKIDALPNDAADDDTLSSMSLERLLEERDQVFEALLAIVRICSTDPTEYDYEEHQGGGPHPCSPEADAGLQAGAALAKVLLLFGGWLSNQTEDDSPMEHESLSNLELTPSPQVFTALWRIVESDAYRLSHLVHIHELKTSTQPNKHSSIATMHKLSSRLRELLARIVQLAASGRVRGAGALAVHLLASWGTLPQALGVDEMCSKLLSRVKALEPQALPGLLLNALQMAWQKADSVNPPPEEELEPDEQPRDACLRQFNSLAHTLASQFAGPSGAELSAAVIEKGALWALRIDPQSSARPVDFLVGIAHFVGKLSGPLALRTLQQVQSIAQTEWPDRDPADLDAEMLLDFLGLLEERTHKAHMRPALKKETPVRNEAPNEPTRHIAFASDVHPISELAEDPIEDHEMGEAPLPTEGEADTEMEDVQENIPIPEPDANEAPPLEEEQEEPPRAFRSRRRA